MRIAAALAFVGVVLVGWGLLYTTIGAAGPRAFPTRNEVAFYVGLVLLALAGIQAVHSWRARHIGRGG